MKRLLALAGRLVPGCSFHASSAAVLGFALSIALVGAGAGAESASPAQTSGSIAFVSNRDGDSDIYAINPDGTGLTQLTHNEVDDFDPMPSPDGKLIAFDAADSPTVMNADGSGRRHLEGCLLLTPGGWSPDSRHFVCYAGLDNGLVVVDTAGGTVRPLAESGAHPAWSPDGRTVAFFDEDRLWVVPAAGGAPRRIGKRKIDEEIVPSWSPDSQRLAYVGPVGSNLDHFGLYTIRADGSGGRRLLDRVAEESPRWSPDGSRIAFMKVLQPHFVSAVYTVRSNGTGVHRVSISRAGESSGDPSWSADGRFLFYVRGRFRDADGADIFVARAETRGGRALTHPFPAGGSSSAPEWLAGHSLSGGEPIPHTIRLPLTRKLTFTEPLDGVVTDGRRAIPHVHAEKSHRLLIWDSATGRTVRTLRPCETSLGELVLAARRLAWTCSEHGNTFSGIWLETLRLGARRPTVVASSVADLHPEGGNAIGNLVGHGSTIAFTNYQLGENKRQDAWLLLPRHASKCPASGLYGSRAVCRALPGAAGGITTSVDAGRVLTAAPDGLVRLLSTRGRVLRTWRLGEAVVNARVRGRSVALQHGASLDIYDTATGAKTQTRPLAANEGRPPFLLDVQGDLVAYATGGAIHLLRLSDGRDVALRLPGAAPWLDARLERAGLFVTWNKMYDRRPGRMTFVPLGQIHLS